MYISQTTIDRVFESVQIEEVIGDFLELKKSGSSYKAKSPFTDEKTPSFMVSPVKNIYKCFSSGKGGNAVSFLMDAQNMTYPEAIEYLAEKYNIEVEADQPDPKREATLKKKHKLTDFNKIVAEYFHKQLYLPENSLALEYVNQRFEKQTIDQWQIGFAPKNFTRFYEGAKKKGFDDAFLLSSGLVKQSQKNGKTYDFFQNRIIFPVWDHQGNIISFSGRAMPGAAKEQAKYINLSETTAYNKSNVLYGLNFAIKNIAKTKIAVLVEGNPDCIRLHEIGIVNVVAPSGTALADGQIILLNRFADKIILLYDGDDAGQKALIKNGKLLVKKGLIPYAAVLPADEDPDSFFKSIAFYNKWIKKNQSDFISWYANRLFEKIGEDPSLKNDAINEISDMLMYVSKTKRQLYIESITKSSKLKGKLFTDRIKELEARNIKEEDKPQVVPKGVDANDFEKWGFYEYGNCYNFRTKSGIEELSNFVMKPVFHIDSIIDSQRIYELVNKHGYRVVVNLDMNEMTSLQGFQRNVESKGNFMFWGQMQQFQRLKLKLYEETRTCTEIKNLGWQKEGFWAWANGMLDVDGTFSEIDEYGVVTHKQENYFIPAFSKIYIKDKSVYMDERKFQFRKSEISLNNWLSLYIKVNGPNSMVAFAWYLSVLFRDHILYLNDNFPLLNLFGQKGSGKNTLAYSLLSLFGKKQTEFNIHNGTKPGLAKHLEMFRNAIAFVDEYKNSLDFDKIETLKSIYNAIGRSRLNMDKGGKKETTEVNQGVIVAGQEMPTIDTALSSRMLFLTFLSKQGLSSEAKKDFETLQEMERDGLPHITSGFLQHRNHFIGFYKENYDSVMRELVEATGDEEINDRLLRNICTVMASFKTLESKFDFPFSFKQLLAEGLKVTRTHNKQLSQSDEIGVFWNLLEAMFDDNLLIDKWHFIVNLKTSLKTTHGVKEFPEGKRVLRFKFNAIAKMYSEQLRRSGEKPLPKDSLHHYLTTSKYFIGVERSCKFIRKDFIQAEGRVIEKKQTTTAFCFDYEMLSIKTKINLEREDIETMEPSANGHADSYTESKSKKLEQTDMPF